MLYFDLEALGRWKTNNTWFLWQPFCEKSVPPKIDRICLGCGPRPLLTPWVKLACAPSSETDPDNVLHYLDVGQPSTSPPSVLLQRQSERDSLLSQWCWGREKLLKQIAVEPFPSDTQETVASGVWVGGAAVVCIMYAFFTGGVGGGGVEGRGGGGVITVCLDMW